MLLLMKFITTNLSKHSAVKMPIQKIFKKTEEAFREVTCVHISNINICSIRNNLLQDCKIRGPNRVRTNGIPVWSKNLTASMAEWTDICRPSYVCHDKNILSRALWVKFPARSTILNFKACSSLTSREVYKNGFNFFVPQLVSDIAAIKEFIHKLA